MTLPAHLSDDRSGGRSDWSIRFGPAGRVASGPSFRASAAGAPATASTSGRPSPQAEAHQLARRHDRLLLFEGRLHNAEQLRHLLGAPPVRREAELLVRAYEAWGRRLLQHLKGEFALVVVDERRGELFAARDRIGAHPLYYRNEGGEIAVSAAIGSFGSRPLDQAVLSQSLSGGRPSAHSTPYRGVRRLLPGHFLHFDRNGLTCERYWWPPVPGNDHAWLRAQDLDRFDELLEEAALRYAGQGRTAIYLSGGIDSVSVATATYDAARREGRQMPLAVSLHYPGEDEEPRIQKAVAERLGIEHLTLALDEALGSAGLLANCIEISSRSVLPLQNPWRPATDRLACLARAHGCTSILTGSGGDEWLTADAIVTADYLVKGDLVGLARYLDSLRRSLELPPVDLLRGVVWRRGAKPVLRDLLGRVRRSSLHLPERRPGPAWLVHVADDQDVTPEERSHGVPYYQQAVANLPLHPLRVHEAEEKFNASRELGIGHTDIYWDADLVEFLCRVPPHLLNRGGRTKGLVRARLARRFPGLGLERQKKVVSRNLLGSLILQEGMAVWESSGGAPALAELGLVEPVKLEEFVRRSFATGDPKSVDALWRILSLESWARPRI